MMPLLSIWTVGAGATTSAAAASSAAIFGPARSATSNQPAVSRRLANSIEFARLSSAATSENSAACCVQATVSGPSSAATALNRPSSAPQSCVAAVTSPRHPRRIASRSSGIVVSQEQIRMRLPVSDTTVTISRLPTGPIISGVYTARAGKDDARIVSARLSSAHGAVASRSREGALVSTSLARVAVGVAIVRRMAMCAWAVFLWRPVSVVAGEPAAQPWTPIGGEGDVVLFYAGEAVIELHRTETTNSRENLASGSPTQWVNMRPTGSEPPYELLAVTADPAEGE